MNRAIAAAELAWNEKRGAWAEFGNDVLLGYEFRICIKLGKEVRDGTTIPLTQQDGMRSAFERICVDLQNLQVVGEYGFHAVPPCYRLWYWRKHEAEAVQNLGLHQ